MRGVLRVLRNARDHHHQRRRRRRRRRFRQRRAAGALADGRGRFDSRPEHVTQQQQQLAVPEGGGEGLPSEREGRDGAHQVTKGDGAATARDRFGGRKEHQV
jgi:hypothetical protein